MSGVFNMSLTIIARKPVFRTSHYKVVALNLSPGEIQRPRRGLLHYRVQRLLKRPLQLGGILHDSNSSRELIFLKSRRQSRIGGPTITPFICHLPGPSRPSGAPHSGMPRWPALGNKRGNRRSAYSCWIEQTFHDGNERDGALHKHRRGIEILVFEVQTRGPYDAQK